MRLGVWGETIVKFFEQEHIHPVVLDHLIPALHITFDTTFPKVKVSANLVSKIE
jgi:hypothetical protein